MRTFLIFLAFSYSLAMFQSCNDRIEIFQRYGFSLSSWVLPTEIVPGERVEIRFYLSRQGDYKGTVYRVGYIQMAGDGDVYDSGGQKLVSRETIPLGSVAGLDVSDPCNQVFTLFYESKVDKQSELRFFVEDNFGRMEILDVDFDVVNKALCFFVD